MIKRYDLPLTSPDCMQPNDTGEYVRYDDHAAEVERLSTDGLHQVALSIATSNALPDILAELHTLRARVAELERDARLGAAMREAVIYGAAWAENARFYSAKIIDPVECAAAASEAAEKAVEFWRAAQKRTEKETEK